MIFRVIDDKFLSSGITIVSIIEKKGEKNGGGGFDKK